MIMAVVHVRTGQVIANVLRLVRARSAADTALRA